MKNRRRLRSKRKKERELFEASLHLMGFKLSENLKFKPKVRHNINLYINDNMRVIVRPKFINVYVFRNTEQKPAEGITLGFSIELFLNYIHKFGL